MLLRIIQEIAWVPAVFRYESGVKEQKGGNGLKQIHTKWVMFVSPTWTSQWKQKKKVGGGICWNSMSLDSIWTICSSRLGHILMIKLLILSSILSATQYFHDLLLADLTHYLFGLYHSHDKRLQLQPWSLTRRFGARSLRCRGRWRRRVQRSTDRKHFWMWSPLTPRQRGLEQVTSSPCASVFLSTKWV